MTPEQGRTRPSIALPRAWLHCFGGVPILSHRGVIKQRAERICRRLTENNERTLYVLFMHLLGFFHSSSTRLRIVYPLTSPGRKGLQPVSPPPPHAFPTCFSLTDGNPRRRCKRKEARARARARTRIAPGRLDTTLYRKYEPNLLASEFGAWVSRR
jgi:hypothetical protein